MPLTITFPVMFNKPLVREVDRFGPETIWPVVNKLWLAKLVPGAQAEPFQRRGSPVVGVAAETGLFCKPTTVWAKSLPDKSLLNVMVAPGAGSGSQTSPVQVKT